ncbi:MAG: hypothetical protein HY331_11395 [Chloroflexi bacterium]|nr:hypothetical protein [Chloroflexota bacterium]
MERLALWTRIKPGEEEKLRYHLARHLPARALEHAGIRELTAFVGSGHCLMTFAYEGTFDDVFARYVGDREIAEWLDRISPLVENVPVPIKGATGEQLVADDVVHWELFEPETGGEAT